MLSKIKTVFILVIASGINEVVKLISKTKNVAFLHILGDVFVFIFCPIKVLTHWDQISAFVLKLFLLCKW